MIKLIASLGFLSFLATSASAVTTIGSDGLNECSEWLSVKDHSNEGSTEGWVLGFLSGLAVGDKKDFLRDAKVSSVIQAITDGCKLQPDLTIAEVVLSIGEKMEK